MSGLTASAIIAIMLGLGIGFVLFVPFVAISYRRNGRLSALRFLLWAAALVYFWAIWTYTLLPLPTPETIRCVGVVTDPLDLFREIQKGLGSGNPVTDPAIRQLALNVLLFMPLGFFLRVLGGRGILVAFLAGLGLSLLVETTQLTGVWGIYPCAYRFFDVGDLATNTVGAVLGSLAAFIVPRRHHGRKTSPDAGLPRPVTKGRRALGMLCDGLSFGFVLFFTGTVAQLWMQYVVRDPERMLDSDASGIVGTVAASAVWLLIILITGRSVGDLTVQLRYTGGPVPVPLARLLRWLGGYAGLSALGLVGNLGALVVWPLLLLSVILLVTTRNGRGLPGVISGQQLVDAREPASVAPPGDGTSSIRWLRTSR